MVIPLDKEILVQYIDMKEEIKDLRKRIKKISDDIDKLSVVSDSVKGTRRDGTIGPIKVTGFPYPRYQRMKSILETRRSRLAKLEVELMELTSQVEEYIDSIEKSEMRTIFRLYYIDGLTWSKVAFKMNQIFPKRHRAYSEDSCRCKHDRFLEKNEKTTVTTV